MKKTFIIKRRYATLAAEGNLHKRRYAKRRAIFIMMICCLALTACGKNKDPKPGPTIPNGYTVKDRGDFYNMEDCINHEKQEIEKANVDNVREFNSGTEYAVSGNLKNSDAVLYFCHAGHDTKYNNAVFTFAVKPAS
ncbi:MAG: hypothetical protein ABSA26_18775 [Thermoguttaceae bacterium]